MEYKIDFTSKFWVHVLFAFERHYKAPSSVSFSSGSAIRYFFPFFFDMKRAWSCDSDNTVAHKGAVILKCSLKYL